MAKTDPPPPAEAETPPTEQPPATGGVVTAEPVLEQPAPLTVPDSAAEPEQPAEASPLKPWQTAPTPTPEPVQDVPGWYRNTGHTTIVLLPDGAPSAELAPGEAAHLPRDPMHPYLKACDVPAADTVKEG